MKKLIYLEDAIDALMTILDKPNHAEFLYTDEICKVLNELPSAEPEKVYIVKAALSSEEQILEVVKKVKAEMARSMPTVIEPERKTGRWKSHDCLGSPSIDKDVCSCCGQRFYQIAETGCEWNFCPNCGARMEEPT